MSQISLKSISGITSITTPAGVDNVFTVHTNDTVERFRIDQSGNQNISGIITATAFHGDGSNLTGITQTTINNNADNRLITGSGTANTLEGEANLTWNGQTFEAYNASGPSYIAAKSNTNSGDYGIVQVQSGSTVRGRLVSDAAVDAFRLDTAGRATAPITFHTGSSYTEALRISESNFLVSQSNTDAVLNNWAGAAISIKNTSNTDNNKSVIYFTNSANGIDSAIQGIHEDANGTGTARRSILSFGTAGSGTNGSVRERFRITGNGRFGLNTNSPQYAMHLSPEVGQSRIDLHMTNDTTGHTNNDGVQFGYQNSAGAYIWNFENTDIYFGTNNINRLIIETSASTTFNFRPNTNNVCSLGTNSHRWANIHTNDLNLSNEGNSNEIDGTWGQYTIQEGQDDLFLINRRNGKRYKFLLQEID